MNLTVEQVFFLGCCVGTFFMLSISMIVMLIIIFRGD